MFIMDKSGSSSHVERVDAEDANPDAQILESKVNVTGTVQLTVGKIVYIPTPTSDPLGLSTILTAPSPRAC